MMPWLLVSAGVLSVACLLAAVHTAAENAMLHRETQELRKQLRAFIALNGKALARERGSEYTPPSTS